MRLFAVTVFLLISGNVYSEDSNYYLGTGFNNWSYKESNGPSTSFKDIVLITGIELNKVSSIELRLGNSLSAGAIAPGIDIETDTFVSLYLKSSSKLSIANAHWLIGFSNVKLKASNGKTDSADGVSAGLGLSKNISSNLSANIEYIYLVKGGEDNYTISGLGFGLQFKF
ncbi:MAG: outer membrane beta-barrel protein [Candidatus Marinimicrobia bacterium]|jgi:opacity protein-like surface antigen|nr:outer membrane beta-barrel protein [Candidatus Neomarinimicrobiota bacterium]